MGEVAAALDRALFKKRAPYMGSPASGDAAAQLKVGGPGGGPIGGGGCSAGSGTANSLPRLAPWLIGLRKDGARVVDSIISAPTGTSSPSRF